MKGVFLETVEHPLDLNSPRVQAAMMSLGVEEMEIVPVYEDDLKYTNQHLMVGNEYFKAKRFQIVQKKRDELIAKV